MEQNISEQINIVINNLAEKLGVAIETIYPMLKMQALINGIWGIFWVIITPIVFGISLKYFSKHINLFNESEDWDIHGTIIIITVIIGLISILGFIFAMADLKDSITALINPDWYIINGLLKSLIK